MGNKNQHQQSVIVEETVIEDATFQQQAVQEMIIKDGTVTHIGGGQYNGFIQGSCLLKVYIFMEKESTF